jgi:hypothetical protein
VLGRLHTPLHSSLDLFGPLASEPVRCSDRMFGTLAKGLGRAHSVANPLRSRLTTRRVDASVSARASSYGRKQ